MIILSWNVRGIGNDRTFKVLQKFLHLYKPQLVFLCEAKLSVMQMNNVGKKLKLESCFTVSRNGKSGGLAMLWSQDIKVDIASFSDHHIDAEVEVENGKHMRCTGVYGHPKASQKKHTWTLLRWLAGLSFSSWFYFGNFNEILHLDEKKWRK